jgi:hypothetical protein
MKRLAHNFKIVSAMAKTIAKADIAPLWNG